MDAKDLANGIYLQYYYSVIARRGECAWIKDERVATACLKIAEQITNEDNRTFGIMLAGTNGVGKTTMARAFQSVVNMILPKMHTDIKGVLFTTAKDIMNGCWHPDRLKEEPILIIDDLGDESSETRQYGNISTPVIDVLEARYDKQLYTFITTNLTADQIQDKYGLRIRDRLREMMMMHTIEQGSYRK